MRKAKEGLNIFIDENWREATIDIYVYYKANGVIYTRDDKSLGFRKEIEPGTFFDPLIRMPINSDFLELLKTALEKYGVKSEEDSEIKGKLIATKRHLNDMRKIVFNTLKIK